MFDNFKNIFSSDDQQNDMIEVLIKHLEGLRKKAVSSHPTDQFEKYKSYYTGKKDSNEGSKPKNKFNVIKGIVDTKKTLILDNEIVSTVMPRLKTFVDKDELIMQNDLADILSDINSYVLDSNNFEKIKTDVVLDVLVYGAGITETIWEQDNEGELGDVKINNIEPLNFFPDMSARSIQDCNFVFVKESYSSISLKKKYPKYAEKIQRTQTDGKSTNDYKNSKEPTGITTLSDDYNTTQAYTYGSQGLKEEKQKNITVWKCYLKDDSTFQATESDDSTDSKEAQLKFMYPNGRLIVYVDGAKDYILEDKPIDYPFGFPIDIYTTSSNELFGPSEIEYLMEIQDRINNAFLRVQYLVASYVSFLAVNDMVMLEPEDIVNQSILKVENLTDGSISTITNNTLSELTTMIKYIDQLKQYAYEISRVNPTMISGERPQGVTSGEQIVQLNDSPMLAIKEYQRHFKYFICSQGKKNIVLVQLFYNTPRMVRLTKSKQVAQLPNSIDPNDPSQQGLQQQPINILKQVEDEEGKTYFEAIREIQGDLSIGEYDVQVIAGTEMPRSRQERAQITMQLAQMGFLGNDKTEVAEEVLTALDYPLRHQIISKMEADKAELEKGQPPLPPAKDIASMFHFMPDWAKNQWLMANNWNPPSPEVQNLETLKSAQDLIKD